MNMNMIWGGADDQRRIQASTSGQISHPILMGVPKLPVAIIIVVRYVCMYTKRKNSRPGLDSKVRSSLTVAGYVRRSRWMVYTILYDDPGVSTRNCAIGSEFGGSHRFIRLLFFRLK